MISAFKQTPQWVAEEYDSKEEREVRLRETCKILGEINVSCMDERLQAIGWASLRST